MIFDKNIEAIQWEKTVFPTNNARKTGYHMPMNEIGPLPYKKIISKLSVT